MEEAGLVDFSPAFDPTNVMLKSSIDFLRDLKVEFIKTASVFNKLKGTEDGQIKVYGISKTHADFMLFRNGYKLIFSLIKPGEVMIQFHHLSSPFVGEDYKQAPDEEKTTAPIPQTILNGVWGAFGEVIWTKGNRRINPNYLVKFYIKNFVQNSAK